MGGDGQFLVRTLDQRVEGSTPSRPTNKIRRFGDILKRLIRFQVLFPFQAPEA
jgi:hypothetical protein